MDAVTLVAAALSLAVDQSRNAAMEDIMQERERQAMHAAGLESMMAQRMYIANMQLPQQPGVPPVTWRRAHNRAQDVVEDLLVTIDHAARTLRRGHDQQASDLLEDTLTRLVMESDSSEPADSDASSLPAEPADSDAEPEPDEQMLAEPDEQMLAEPEEQVLRRCAGCGRMSANVILQWPAGRWTDLPAEDRMLCIDCEAADV